MKGKFVNIVTSPIMTSKLGLHANHFNFSTFGYSWEIVFKPFEKRFSMLIQQ